VGCTVTFDPDFEMEIPADKGGHMARWGDINNAIRECRSRPDPEPCLRQLFEETKDGMAALALGEEVERQSRLDEALDFFEQAERLFPLERYKERAREAIDRVRTRIACSRSHGLERTEAKEDDAKPKSTLYIVSCTKTKIWDQDPDAPKYVPAKDAYLGHKMKEWLQSQHYRQARYWLILSAKYGFIEPDQPIPYYDVTFGDDTTGPLSLDSLRAQVECQRFGQSGWRPTDFGRVEVWGSDLYYKIVCSAFMRTPLQVVRIAPSAD